MKQYTVDIERDGKIIALRMGSFNTFDAAVRAAKEEAIRHDGILVGVRLSRFKLEAE